MSKAVLLNILVMLWTNYILNEASPVPAVVAGRVRRQAGYVYNRPSVSFDLPARGTTAVTQGITPAQQMYYAYPAPSGGGVVSIGNANAGVTAAPGGYSSGTQTQSTVGVQGTSTTGYQGSTTAQSGYNYNAPSTTTIPSSTTQQVPSTNAPRYLPPTGGGGVVIGGGGGGPTSTYGRTTQGITSTTGTPGTVPTAYLPPVTQPTVTARPLPSLSTGYLPPSSPSPTFPPATLPSTFTPPTQPTSTYSPSPQPSPVPAPTAGYLPPAVSTPGTQISVSTPAPTYLPPLL